MKNKTFKILQSIPADIINAEDAAVFLDEHKVELTDELFEALKQREIAGTPKSLFVGDIVTVKGRNGNPDFTANYRGKNEGMAIIVPTNGLQFSVPMEDIIY